MSASGSLLVTMPAADNLKVVLYDLDGNSLGTLFNAHAEAGEHVIPIATDRLPSGVFYCVIHAGGKAMVREIRVVR
jgi:hypothetical protein